jgi:hypothetical protein
MQFKKHLINIFNLILVNLILISPALSEYRAYQLLVERPEPQVRDGKFRWVVVTPLSPTHYSSYHGGSRAIRTRLLRTWMCPGDTGSFQRTCKSPYPLQKIPKELLDDRTIAFEKIPDFLKEELEKRGWTPEEEKQNERALAGEAVN